MAAGGSSATELKSTFTFSDREDLKHPATGNLTQMRHLLAGHTVRDVGVGMYIPFINGNETSSDSHFRNRELGYRTDMNQAVQYFGAQALRVLPH